MNRRLNLSSVDREGLSGSIVKMITIPTKDLPNVAVEVNRLNRTSSWELAVALYRMDAEGTLGEQSLTSWAREKLGMSSGHTSKYRQAAAALIRATPEVRAQLLKVTVFQFYESGLLRLSKSRPKTALRIIRSGGSQRGLRKKVQKIETPSPTPSWDTNLKIGSEGLRITLTAIARERAGLLVGMRIEGKKVENFPDLSPDTLAEKLLYVAELLGVRDRLQASTGHRAA